MYALLGKQMTGTPARTVFQVGGLGALQIIDLEVKNVLHTLIMSY